MYFINILIYTITHIRSNKFLLNSLKSYKILLSVFKENISYKMPLEKVLKNFDFIF